MRRTLHITAGDSGAVGVKAEGLAVVEDSETAAAAMVVDSVAVVVGTDSAAEAMVADLVAAAWVASVRPRPRRNNLKTQRQTKQHYVFFSFCVPNETTQHASHERHDTFALKKPKTKY